MTPRLLGCLVAALLAQGALAQTATGSATMNTQAGASGSGYGNLPPPPATPSTPSRPSTASGPSMAGAAMPAPDNGGLAGGMNASTTGGSGSAGLAAMGGGFDSDSSATRTMGAGALTECPLGTERRNGMCAPYGSGKKKVQQP